MAFTGGVTMPIAEIDDMIAVRDCFMSAALTVDVVKLLS